MELFDIKTEAKVLGRLMAISAAQINEYRTATTNPLQVGYFFNHKHQLIAQAIFDAVDNGVQQPSIMFIMPYIPTVMTAPTVAELIEITLDGQEIVSDVQIPQLIAMLAELYNRRSLQQIGTLLANSSENMTQDIAVTIEAAQQSLITIGTQAQTGIIPLGTTMQEVRETALKNMTTEQRNFSVTGFPFIDDRGGLQPSNLIIVAGATSQGKTSFATAITLNAIRHGSRIAFYSLEMTRQQLTSRLLSVDSSLPSNRILTDKLNELEFMQLETSIGNYQSIYNSLFFDDRSTSSLDAILASIRTMKSKHDIHGAIIDYLQILTVNQRTANTNVEEQLAQSARKFKNIAKELDIWIVLLSQLHRNLQSPFPTLDRLRGSGQIAEAADNVMLVYRPQYYNEEYGLSLTYPVPYANVDTTNTAMIIVAKGRNIGVGRFICGFKPDTTYFYPLTNLPYKDNNQNNENNNPQKELSPFNDSPF